MALALPMPAAVFKQAEVTRVLNDVRVVPELANAVAARIGDVVKGKTAVATGVQSRAELRFPDKTLTRLGANTLFRLEEGTRDIDMERGVLMLQVPKQLGGARVRTAAVTAAVTGTTILVEFQPGENGKEGHIKIIVVEGELDLYMNASPSTFITLKAGDMIIMKPDAKSFPLPVKVDLERLLATSKLFDDSEFGPVGNNKQITDAVEDQEKKMAGGELMKTAFMLPGRGTQVALSNEMRRELLRFQTPETAQNDPPAEEASSPNGGGGRRPPANSDADRAPIIRPYNPGTTVITDEDPVSTNPHLTAYNSGANGRVTAQGFYYNPDLDGSAGQMLFGRQGSPEVDSLVSAAGVWSAFYFEDLIINGNPVVNSISGVRNLLLASDAGIALQGNESYVGGTVSPGAPLGSGNVTLDSSLDSFMLASNLGPIVIDQNFYLSAPGGQRIIFQTLGPNADIIINSSDGFFTQIDAAEGSFLAAAGRDLLFHGAGINASEVNLQSKRDVVIDTSAQIRGTKSIKVSALRHITVSDSSQLGALTDFGLGELLLLAGGDLSVLDSTLSAGAVTLEAKAGTMNIARSLISGDVIRARTLAANGEMIIDGATFSATNLVRLYAEGSNGHLRFISNSTLNGSRVDLGAKTVTINPGVDVDVGTPAGLKVYTDNANYNRPSAPNSNGRFVNGGATLDVQPQAFGNRPGFNAP